jgi:hypothetical protein
MEIEPDGAAEAHGQILEQALGEQAQLDVPYIGSQLAADRLAIAFGLAVGMLRAVAAPDRFHVLHPEVIGIGADGVDGLFETDFDFEAPAVEADDFQGFQGQIRAEQHQPAARGMDHPDEADQAAQLAPDQIKRVIAQRDAGFAIDRAGRFGELLFVAEPVVEFGFVKGSDLNGP